MKRVSVFRACAFLVLLACLLVATLVLVTVVAEALAGDDEPVRQGGAQATARPVRVIVRPHRRLEMKSGR